MTCFYSNEIFEINKNNIKHFKSFFNLNNEGKSKIISPEINEVIDNDPSKILYDKKIFLTDYYYRFFDPFLYYSDEQLRFVNNDLNKEFDVYELSLFNVKKELPKYYNVKFKFNANWNEKCTEYISKDISLNYMSSNEFSKQFEKYFINKFFNLYSYNISSIVDNVSIIDNKLIIGQKFDLHFKIEFNYDVIHNEICEIEIKNSDNYKILEKTFNLKLPCENTVDQWNKNKDYYINDIVFYSNNDIVGYFKCLEDHKSDYFILDKWKLLEKHALSFSSCSNFYSTVYGRKTYELLQKSISYLCSYYLGKKITLAFYYIKNYRIPKINDWFVYEDVKYRIIKIQKLVNDQKSYIKIEGIEYFNIDENLFNDLEFKDIDKDNEDISISYNSESNQKILIQCKKNYKKIIIAKKNIDLRNNYE